MNPNFARFVELQLESRDMDPVYPVLRARVADFDLADRVRYCLLYCAYYHLGSAELAFRGLRGPRPTGIERRGLRSQEAMDRHLTALQPFMDPFTYMSRLTDGFGADPVRNYYQLRDYTLLSPAAGGSGIWGNGRWASYKTAEVLIEVCDLNAVVADMGNEGSSGPRQGLEVLFGRTFSTTEADEAGWALQQEFAESGVALPTIAQIETALCNWHSLVRGRYYSGHDIDEMQEHIDIGGWGDELRQARLHALPAFTLGELNGWHGVDRARMTAYRDAHVVLRRNELWV